MWKIKMVRQLTDKASPNVIVESSFDYELPADWSAMLENIDMVEEPYRDSVFEGVIQYCMDEHAGAGFYPKDLIAP